MANNSEFLRKENGSLVYKGFPFGTELQSLIHSRLVETRNEATHDNPEFQSGVAIQAVFDYFEHINAEFSVNEETAKRQNVRRGDLI